MTYKEKNSFAEFYHAINRIFDPKEHLLEEKVFKSGDFSVRLDSTSLFFEYDSEMLNHGDVLFGVIWERVDGKPQFRFHGHPNIPENPEKKGIEALISEPYTDLEEFLRLTVVGVECCYLDIIDDYDKKAEEERFEREGKRYTFELPCYPKMDSFTKEEIKKRYGIEALEPIKLYGKEFHPDYDWGYEYIFNSGLYDETSDEHDGIYEVSVEDECIKNTMMVPAIWITLYRMLEFCEENPEYLMIQEEGFLDSLSRERDGEDYEVRNKLHIECDLDTPVSFSIGFWNEIVRAIEIMGGPEEATKRYSREVEVVDDLDEDEDDGNNNS